MPTQSHPATLPTRHKFGAGVVLAAVAVGTIGVGLSTGPESAQAAEATFTIGAGAPVIANNINSWVGQFSGSDGSTTYCIDGPKHYPWENGGVTYGEPYTVDQFTNSATPTNTISEAETARLGWIMDKYGKAGGDSLTASAVQLLVWNLTWNPPGVSGIEGDGYNLADAQNRANEILADADANGYMSSRATPTMNKNSDGTGTLNVKVELQRFDGTWVEAAPGAHVGKVSLTNGAFAGSGDTTADIGNGIDYNVYGTGTAGKAQIVATAEFPLVAKYNITLRDPLGPNAADYQRLIQANVEYDKARTSTAPIETPTKNPAQIVVSTVASEHVVDENDLPVTIKDNITVGVADTDANPNAAWPTDNEGNPLPVEITVTLYKAPGNGPIAESPTVPADAVAIGTDTITVTAPGEYQTPAGVEITESGRYVFVETSKEVVTPIGGEDIVKVPAFTGNYGISNESTYIPYRPTVSTNSVYDTPYLGTNVADSFKVENFAPGAAPVTVDVYAVGPFAPGDERPDLTNAAAIPADLLAGQGEVVINGNGDYTTPEIEGATDEVGTYYFMYEYDGGPLPTEPNPDVVIPSFKDFGYYAEESYEVAPTPKVTTNTSDQIASIGATITDKLAVTGLQDGDEMTVVSTLHGPIDGAVAGQDIPANTPVVGTTTTVVTANGVVDTEGLQVDAPGDYVWTYEYTTKGKDGGSKPAKPVNDKKIYATETSFVPELPEVTTQTHLQEAYTGAVLSDHLVATGFDQYEIAKQLGIETPVDDKDGETPSTEAPVDGEAPVVDAAGVPVDSILIGPFTADTLPAEGEVLTDEFIAANEVGRVTTNVTHDGEYQTEGIKVEAEGLYLFVYESDGLPGEGDKTIVPKFKDSSVHKPETTLVNKSISITSNVAEKDAKPGKLSEGDEIIVSVAPVADGTFGAGDKVSDVLHIQGYSETALPDGFDVKSTLVGPFLPGEEPAIGSVIDLATAPIVGESVTTKITSNGSWVTEPVTLPDDAPEGATYFWVYSADEALQLDSSVYAEEAEVDPTASPTATETATATPTATPGGDEIVTEIGSSIGNPDDERNIVLPAFEDTTAYAEESFTTEVTPDGPEPAKGQGGGLAQTGSDLGWLALLLGGSAVVGGGLVVRNKLKGKKA